MSCSRGITTSGVRSKGSAGDETISRRRLLCLPLVVPGLLSELLPSESKVSTLDYRGNDRPDRTDERMATVTVKRSEQNSYSMQRNKWHLLLAFRLFKCLRNTRPFGTLPIGISSDITEFIATPCPRPLFARSR